MEKEELLDRFNDINIQMIHIKSQFDMLLQSFNVYVNLESKLDQYKEQLAAYQQVINSYALSNADITAEQSDLRERLLKIENKSSDNFLSEEFDYTAPPSENCDGCSV
jgi:hypothetical protein